MTTRCVADSRHFTEDILSSNNNSNGNRKTTHSWPVICRNKNNQYRGTIEKVNTITSNVDDYFDDEDNDDDENDDQDDEETIFDVNKSQSERGSCENLSTRKYLVVDYHQSSKSSSIGLNSKLNAQRKSIVARMSTASSQPRLSNAAAESTLCPTTASQTTCTTSPPVVFLLATLLMTISATTMLCMAVMTDHWETISWDREVLIRLTNDTSHKLHWHLNNRVARLSISRECKMISILLLTVEILYVFSSLFYWHRIRQTREYIFRTDARWNLDVVH